MVTASKGLLLPPWTLTFSICLTTDIPDKTLPKTTCFPSNQGVITERKWEKDTERHRQNSYLIIHSPTSEGVSKVNKQVSAAECTSKMSRVEHANK